MKTVILAGGYGTRISEESAIRPKPMVEIGSKPILWHIMKIYSAHGMNDFVICCGYKGYVIKDFFSKYFLHMSDVTFDLRKNEMRVHHNNVEPWRVSLIDTGEETMTGGRLKRVREYIGNDTFCLTYGDGVADLNITELVRFHRKTGLLVTLTAVQAPGRFGAITLKGDQYKVSSFREKPLGDGAWINGGFFVCEPGVIDYIEDDTTVWEQEPLQKLSQEGMLAAFKHHGFWHPMDTLRDKNALEKFWRGGDAPWKVW
jgi:glucose-1-phosphate cytidylyltransferase